jgi:micrococcal nuclease
MYTYNAELIKITDGDTVVVRIDQGRRTYSDITLRLEDINAPEIRAKGLEGENSRDALIALMSSGKFVIQTYKDPGSYDRYTAMLWKDAKVTVVIEGLNINKWMVDNGHAVKYDYPWD